MVQEVHEHGRKLIAIRQSGAVVISRVYFSNKQTMYIPLEKDSLARGVLYLAVRPLPILATKKATLFAGAVAHPLHL